MADSTQTKKKPVTVPPYLWILLFIAYACFSGCGIASIPKTSVMVSADVVKRIRVGRQNHINAIDEIQIAKTTIIDLWMEEWFKRMIPIVAEDEGILDNDFFKNYEELRKFTAWVKRSGIGYIKKREEMLKEVRDAANIARRQVRDEWDFTLQEAIVIHDNIKAVNDLKDMRKELLQKMGAPAIVIDPVGEMNKKLKDLVGKKGLEVTKDELDKLAPKEK